MGVLLLDTVRAASGPILTVTVVVPVVEPIWAADVIDPNIVMAAIKGRTRTMIFMV